jgi:hypothetical protein
MSALSISSRTCCFRVVQANLDCRISSWSRTTSAWATRLLSGMFNWKPTL